MTDNLLQKLEEKVMSLLTELESIRKELGQVRQENTALKSEKTNSVKKMQGLISLLEALDISDLATPSLEPEFHGKEEYAVVG